MATGFTRIKNHPFTGDIQIYKWVLTANETGEKVVVPRHSDKTVHVFGTFGGAVTIEGSLDPSMSDTSSDNILLQDNADADLSFTAKDCKAIIQNVYKIGPKAGVGVTSVTIFIMVR